MRIEKRIDLDINDLPIDEYVEVDIDFEDIKEYIISEAGRYEIEDLLAIIKKQIKKISSDDYDIIDPEFIKFDNLYDREKVLLLKELFDKYTLFELQDIIKQLNK